MTITAANAPGVVAYDIMFWKSPSLPPSLEISYKYYKTPYSEATFVLTVSTETEVVFEMVGLAENEKKIECDGVKISATVNAPALGKYILDSKWCNSAFAEITIAKDGNESKYSASLGIQNPYNVEISLLEGSTKSEEAEPIVLARTRLVSPSMVMIEFACKKERLDTLWVRWCHVYAFDMITFLEHFILSIFKHKISEHMITV